MSEEKTEGTAGPAADPFATWIQFYENWTKAWSGAMSEAVASKRFAETMGQQMEGSLEALALVRRQANDLMEQYLEQMSLPTRKEVASLAERLTKVEMTLDDLDAKVDEILDLLRDQGALRSAEHPKD